VENVKPKFNFQAITIACTDVERSKRFYRDVLGGVDLPSDNGVSCWFRLGSLHLNLLPNATEPSPAEFPKHAMPILWMEVQDLATAAKWFARHGVVVVDPGDGQFMQIFDPDRILIEVWEAQPAA